jgi:hypothetical protein
LGIPGPGRGRAAGDEGTRREEADDDEFVPGDWPWGV